MKTEIGKYIVIFILLVTTIGFVSGFLVADNSMLLAYNEGFQKYNIEDGHFVTEKKMNRAQLKSVAASGNTLYEMFYADGKAIPKISRKLANKIPTSSTI